MKVRKTLITSMLSFVLALLLSSIFMLISGYNPIEAFTALFNGAFGSRLSFANTLSKSIPLIFTGLAVSFALKGGIFNIGAEGQLYVGALFGTVTALLLPNMPRMLLIPIVLITSFLGGALSGSVIGLIKAKYHINEVVIAILLNYILQYFVRYILKGPLSSAEMVVQSPIISQQATLTRILPKSQLSTALIIAVVSSVFIYCFFMKTKLGFNIKAIGGNSYAAEASGINCFKYTVIILALSGGIAGLAGITEVIGKHGRLIDGFSNSFGFTGVAVSILANNNPIGIILTALLFGALDSGAMKMTLKVGASASMVTVIQSLIIISVATPGIFEFIFGQKKGELN